MRENFIKRFIYRQRFFSKLMVTYLIIILVTMTMLGLLLGQLYKNYYYTEVKNNLISQGKEINNLLASLNHGEITPKSLVDQITLTDHLSNAQIWISDQYGVIFWTSISARGNVRGSRVSNDFYDSLKNGLIVSKVSKDNSHFDVTMMSVGVPLIVDGKFEGATLFHTPLNIYEHRVTQVYWLIVVAALSSIIFALALIYIISKRISEPIHEMTVVSLAMAGGDFSKKVTAESGDEIGKLAETFNFMVTELGKLEEMRRDFIANVSHELRSPLTSIRGFIQGVLDGTVDKEEQDKYLQIALDESQRLNRLVNDLLELARMEGGNINLKKEAFELSPLLIKVIAQMGIQSATKNITINLDVPEEIKVNADRDRIEQIMINLLDNAIRFTPEKGQINVNVAKQGGKALVSVTDSGVGIAEDEIGSIWDRFYKCDKARTRSKGGTGLGLAIVKHIIKANNEDIKVESRQGEGTTFRFSLTLAE